MACNSCILRILLYCTTAVFGLLVEITPNENLVRLTGSKLRLTCTVTFTPEEFKDIDLNSWVGFEYPSGANTDKLKQRKNKLTSQNKIRTAVSIKDGSAGLSGDYKCAYGDQSKSISVTFNEKLTFDDSAEDANGKQLEVGTKSFDCKAQPSGLKYMWTVGSEEPKEGKTLDFGDGVTKDFDENTEYICEVTRASTGDYDQLVYKFSVVYAPEVTIPESSFVRKEGDSASLVCNVDAKPAADITWSRDGKVIEGQKETTLKLDNLTFADHNGKYKCTANNKIGNEATGEIDVTVVVPPKATITQGESVNVKEGDKLKLECTASGQPSPTKFIWTLPDGTQQPEGSTFKTDANSDHNGEFTCSAWNEVQGETYGPGNATIKVSVQYSPKNKSPSTTIYGVENKNTEMKCIISANPSATVSWKEDPDQNNTTTSTSDDPTETISTYTVLASSENFKTYTCSAKNDISNAEFVFELKKATPPAKPEAPTASDEQIMYQSITFNWKSPESVIPITSYKISYTDKDGNEKDTVSAGADTTMQLTGLKEETEYTFYITAQNEAGDSEKSEGVTLKTKKPVPPTVKITKNETVDTSMKFTYKIDVLGAENLKSIDIKYYEIKADGTKGTAMTKKFTASDFEFNKESKIGTANLTGLEAGKTYEAEITVFNDKIGSEPQKIKFEMKPGTGSSTVTVIGVMLGIIVVLLVFVDISCYYMRQGGLMMTCHKALCSQPEPKVPESSNEEAEKVPLAPENV